MRTLRPQGNTGPMRPAKGNSPGEAELSNGPTECGETAAGAAEPSPRGSKAPLEKLAVTTAFPRGRQATDEVQDGGTAGRQDGGTAGRRDGGTAGQWNDRATGRRDSRTAGQREDGGTVGWRDGGMATQRHYLRSASSRHYLRTAALGTTFGQRVQVVGQPAAGSLHRQLQSFCSP